MSGLRPATCYVRALRHTMRLAGVVVRRVPPAGDRESDQKHSAAHIAAGVGSLGLALLAADHMFNGMFSCCVKINK